MDIVASLHDLLLLGTLQGFIISFLLFYTGPRHADTRILAKILFFVTLVCLNQYLYDAEWIQQNPYLHTGFYLVPIMVIMPVGPLIYRFAKTHQDPAYQPSSNEHLWRLLVIIDIIPYLAAWLFLIGVFTDLIKNSPEPWGYFIDTWQKYADIPRWLSLAGGLFFSWKYILKENFLENRKWIFSFLKAFTVFLFLWLLQLIAYLFPVLRPIWWDKIAWYSIYVPLVILIYWAGFSGFIQSRREKLKAKATNIHPEIFHKVSNLLIEALEGEHLYLNPELNLSRLAQMTNLPQKMISAVLNQYYHKSFSEFINAYRIEAFKQKIAHADLTLLTIMGIARECGFNSQATFQRVFKQTTGQTPTQYLNHLKQQGA